MLVANENFTHFGKAWRRGQFEKIPKESLEYKTLWDEQLDRCYNGYSVGGKWMSGSLYSYVNFGTIRLVDEFQNSQQIGAPILRDVEWMLDYYKLKAISEGKNLMYISGRRLGKSYYASWELAENAVFYNSPGAVGVGTSKYGEDFVQKVKLHLTGLANTPFYIPLLKERSNNATAPIIMGWEFKDKTGKWVKKETGGLVYNINFNRDPTAANGKETRRFIFEEVGMFDNLVTAYSNAEFCWKVGTQAFGFALLHGTGGDMEGGTIHAEKMFYDPETYGLLTFRDDDTDAKIAMFVPGYYSMNEFRDSEGVVDIDVAKSNIKKRRDELKKGKDLKRLFQTMQNEPLTPAEAFLRTGSNVFPAQLIQEQLNRITLNEAERNFGLIGKIVVTEKGVYKFEPDFNLRPNDFPHNKSHNNEGALVCWELPTEHPPFGLYVMGVDPYYQDESVTSSSLGSCFVYKRIKTLTETYDWPVAEYTGRPETSEKFYEQVRKIAKFYNAKVLYESNVPGLKQHFEKKNSLYLLANTPGIVKDIVDDPRGSNMYGITMSTKVKEYIVGLIRNWLLTEFAENHYNVEKIYSAPLLKEMLKYDKDGNFDRIIAFGLALLQDENDFRGKGTQLVEKPKPAFQHVFDHYGL